VNKKVHGMKKDFLMIGVKNQQIKKRTGKNDYENKL